MQTALFRDSSLGRLFERELRRVLSYTLVCSPGRSFASHSTPKKLANLALVEAEWRLRRQTVRGHPYILMIDPANGCNLRYPVCPTGIGMASRRAELLSLPRFKEILDAAAPYLYEASFHNWGELLLNPDVFRMIDYAHDRNVVTNLNTNLNTLRDGDIENIVRSKLEYLSISSDGTTDEVYQAFRRRSGLQLILANLRKLLALRERSGRKTPHVEWQFIVMKQNAHQVDEARRIADEIGVDLLRFVAVGLPLDARNTAELGREWFPDMSRNHGPLSEHRLLQAPRKSACFYLYRSLVVNPDGRVSPCCNVNGTEHDFGEAPEDESIDIRSLLNNSRYRSARSLFASSPAAIASARVPTVCDDCGIFEHRDSRGAPATDAMRRFGDLVGGLTLVLLTLPIMLVMALLIRMDSRGPALFRQTRIGKNRRKQDLVLDARIQPVGDRRKEDWGGRPFTFYKFRTMYVDARERFPELYGYEYTPDQVARLQFKLPQDPRLTRLGTVLRRTTLDELPNFINLVRGDVTLVGPRPEIPEMVKHYRREQRRKFEVKPGITGMAQADGRGLLSFQETLNKDLEYVEKRSLSLDVRIILNTIQVTLLRVGAF